MRNEGERHQESGERPEPTVSQGKRSLEELLGGLGVSPEEFQARIDNPYPDEKKSNATKSRFRRERR